MQAPLIPYPRANQTLLRTTIRNAEEALLLPGVTDCCDEADALSTEGLWHLCLPSTLHIVVQNLPACNHLWAKVNRLQELAVPRLRRRHIGG